MRRITFGLACIAITGTMSQLPSSAVQPRRVKELARFLFAFNPSPALNYRRLGATSADERFSLRMKTAVMDTKMESNPTVAVDAEIESNPMFVDEKAMLAKRGFEIPPSELILLAKRFLVSRGGFGADPDLLSENFQFIGPVVGPLSKDAFVKAIGSVDIKKAFPDFEGEFHNFQVDPFEGNRVWYIARGRGTNTGPFPPFAPGASGTGKTVVNPPQACSLTFNEKGLVTKYTIGYVMDRDVGNTGGVGGLYGILYAIGTPLPFPEAQPWQISNQYRLFQALGELVSRAAQR